MNKGIITAIVLIAGVIGFVSLSGGAKTPEQLARENAEEQASKLVVQQSSEKEEQAEQNGPTLQKLTLEVPDFQFQSTTGEVQLLSDVVNDKPTIVDFWASWCHNCQRNQPIMNDILQSYKDQVNVLAVNMGESRSKVNSYADDKAYDFITAYDENGVIARAFGVQYTNTKYLIDGDGKLLKAFSGDISEEDFKLLIDEA